MGLDNLAFTSVLRDVLDEKLKWLNNGLAPNKQEAFI